MILSQYTKEFKTNFSIAYPIIAGQVAHLLVALADNIMVGKLGPAALASVSLGNTLIFIALSIGIGFSFAITPLVAEADGKNDKSSVSGILQNGLLLCTVNGFMLVLMLFTAEPILYIMDQPPEVVELAIPYMRIVALSLIPLMIFQGLKQFSDGLSLTRFAMYATLLANLINILVNYLLIYGEYGFPKLGVEGAAYGTLISRILMFIFLLVLLLNNVKTRQFFTRLNLLSSSNMLQLLNIGLPTALQMFFEVSLFTAAIFLSGVLGTNVQAANQIALNLSAITFMVGVGLSVTATIRIGNQLGQNNYSDLIRIARSIFLMAIVIDVAFALFFYIGRNYLPYIYIQDEQVISIASSLLVVAAFFQVSDGLQVVILGALRGLQDVWVPSLICFVAYACVGLPIAYYFGSEEVYSGVGIWLGLLSGLTVSAILMYVRFRFLSRRLLRMGC